MRATGKLLTPALYAQLEQMVRLTIRRENERTQHTPNVRDRLKSRFPIRAVVLNEALPPATHGFQPTKAKAGLLQWDAVRETYREVADNFDFIGPTAITVFNHSENSTHSVNTMGLAIPCDGHYWFLGDCSALATRDAPSTE